MKNFGDAIFRFPEKIMLMQVVTMGENMDSEHFHGKMNKMCLITLPNIRDYLYTSLNNLLLIFRHKN